VTSQDSGCKGAAVARLADVSLATQLIGYEPKVKFADDIRRMIDGYETNRGDWS
jgi:hypothetical protein